MRIEDELKSREPEQEEGGAGATSDFGVTASPAVVVMASDLLAAAFDGAVRAARVRGRGRATIAGARQVRRGPVEAG